jgi:Na+-driven multidrug efflux pump
MSDAAALSPRSAPLSRAEAASAARAARTRLLLTGPIAPTLARLAAPNVLAMVVTAAMSIAEGAFAGRLGVGALAGLALVFPLVMLTQMLSAGAMGGAISSAVARALGAGDAARAGRLAGAAWTIAVVAALGSAVLVVLFGRTAFAALGGGDAAIAEALAYALVYFPGCAAIWLCHSSLSLVRGSGSMLLPALVLLLVATAAIPLSGALALGWGPFPALGMAGLAGGQVAAHGLGALAALAYVAGGAAGLPVSFRRLRPALFADILRVGLLASLNAVQTVLTIVVMVALVGRYGEAALAGYGLGARLEFMMVPVVFGIGAAMTAMVGANIGAGDRARALRIGWTGALAAAAIVGAIGFFFAALPDLWLRLFLAAEETAALEAGRAYFRIVAPAYAFFALGLALYFASQGAGRMGWPIAASLLRMAVAIGGALLLTRGFGLGLDGVFLGIAAGMVAYGGLTAAAIRHTAWR